MRLIAHAWDHFFDTLAHSGLGLKAFSQESGKASQTEKNLMAAIEELGPLTGKQIHAVEEIVYNIVQLMREQEKER